MKNLRDYMLDPPVQKDNPICPVCGEECAVTGFDPRMPLSGVRGRMRNNLFGYQFRGLRL